MIELTILTFTIFCRGCNIHQKSSCSPLLYERTYANISDDFNKYKANQIIVMGNSMSYRSGNNVAHVAHTINNSTPTCRITMRSLPGVLSFADGPGIADIDVEVGAWFSSSEEEYEERMFVHMKSVAYERAHLGINPWRDDDADTGSSVLLELPHKDDDGKKTKINVTRRSKRPTRTTSTTCMYVGESISGIYSPVVTFQLPPGERIIAFYSPVGNSSVVYPFAIGEKFVYIWFGDEGERERSMMTIPTHVYIQACCPNVKSAAAVAKEVLDPTHLKTIVRSAGEEVGDPYYLMITRPAVAKEWKKKAGHVPVNDALSLRPLERKKGSMDTDYMVNSRSEVDDVMQKFRELDAKNRRNTIEFFL